MSTFRKLLPVILLGALGATIEAPTRLMASGDQPPRLAPQKTPPAASTAPDSPLCASDTQAEEQLFQLSNQARREAGAPPLALDAGLSRAALAHARAMLEARQLSHQFDGEPSLAQRLASATGFALDAAAENVALDYNPEQGHQHLMLSPPHRANLLNPAYNVIGLGVVRSADQLYIVEDFGHALPNYSTTELKDRIAAAVNQTRRQVGQPELERRDLLIADSVACSMAGADKIATPELRKLAERFTVLGYTSLDPETLPSGAARALFNRSWYGFSIGACYARTATYPAGVYWVVLSLY